MSISDYEAHTAPVSEAEINFLAVIFGELINQQRKEDNNADKQV